MWHMQCRRAGATARSQTAELATACGLPVVAGGDRHGCSPNAMLNLARGRRFPEFVSEMRGDGVSHIAVTPAYRHPLLARRLEVMADILRVYADHPAGRPQWTDRICYEATPGRPRRLTDHWPEGAPRWLRALVRTVRMLGGRALQPALRFAFKRATDINAWEPRHEWRSSPIRSTR
jgi:hypothetical protein